jgi:hypothetical protein
MFTFFLTIGVTLDLIYYITIGELIHSIPSGTA